MPRLSFDDYLRHIDEESSRLRDVLTVCDPAAAVPSCPEWTALDLLGHHGRVLHFWSTVIEQRPVGPEDLDEPETPSDHAGLLAFHAEQHQRLLDALAGADPADAAWSWAPEQTAGFTFRRQAHEALIHRLDAELSADAVTDLDPRLAADGVDEALAVMFGGKPPWGGFTSRNEHVRVTCTDTGDATWVQLGHFHGTSPEGQTVDTADIAVVTDPGGDPDAEVRGTAAVLDAWLWRRTDDRDVSLLGDVGVLGRFRGCVNQPIT